MGMKEIILSSKNKKDVQEIKEIYRNNLIFHYVDRVDEVYRLAIQKDKIPDAKVWDGSLLSTNREA
ncbi:S16 family serine protease [Candidatus Cardinium hertigii]|uniref:S16 family serine protease n=1 Tax=Candidatus Cardinium hertigii TaxID=247481 RepID=UPI0021A3BEF2|nr:S16 family serine protease [Candidatus Cardinium hertigii]